MEKEHKRTKSSLGLENATVEMAIMNSVRRRPKAIHYHIYSASDMGIHFKKRSLYLRLIKEHIKGSLFFTVSAHLLQVASELARSIYEIERTLCTNKKAILLKLPTCFYHPLDRRRHHFRFVIIGIRTELFNDVTSRPRL